MDRRQFIYLGGMTAFSPFIQAQQISLDDITGGGQPKQAYWEMIEKAIAYGSLQKIASGRVKKYGELITDKEINVRLKSLVTPMFSKAQRKLDWKVYIVSSKVMNACTIGAGINILNAGLIVNCKNWYELASVIAHEIGHNEYRHRIKQMQTNDVLRQYGIEAEKNYAVTIGEQIDDKALEDVDHYVLAILYQAFRRSFEYQADTHIIHLFRQLNYPLDEAANFFETGQKQYPKDYDPGLCLFSTHPHNLERIKRLRAIAKTYASNNSANGFENEQFYLLKQRLLQIL